MDACKHCREYHPEFEVCDAFIEWIKKQDQIDELYWGVSPNMLKEICKLFKTTVND